MADTLTIRLPERLAQALEREAKLTGQAKGEIARQALEARLGRSSDMRAITRHFGTVSGPADLSTNKGHRRTWKRRPS